MLTISKWGNSAAIRINKEILELLGLEEGDALSLKKAEYSSLVLEPVRRIGVRRKVRGRYTLKELLPKSEMLPKINDWDNIPQIEEEIRL